MNCQQIDELILDALDEPLSADDREKVDTHLTACPACVANLQTYVTTVGLLQELGRIEESEIAPPLSEDLVRRILDARNVAQANRASRRTG